VAEHQGLAGGLLGPVQRLLSAHEKTGLELGLGPRQLGLAH
jgi:hypothetical protein